MSHSEFSQEHKHNPDPSHEADANPLDAELPPLPQAVEPQRQTLALEADRSVTLFDGLVSVTEHHQVKAGEQLQVNVPVRRDHLADLLASLDVSGNAHMLHTPSYPEVDDGEGKLSVRSNNVINDLATQLSGTSVRVECVDESVLEGTLGGLDTVAKKNGEAHYLTVYTAQGISRCKMDDVKVFKFLDEKVQKEVNAALSRNLRSIHADATDVSLTLQAKDQDAQAVVRYTLPCASWKTSYRMIRNEQGSFELRPYAHVTNNTAHDWEDVQLKVATGKPISFTTDLADVKSPERRKVNLVDGQAVDHVDVSKSLSKRAQNRRSGPLRAGAEAFMGESLDAAADAAAGYAPAPEVQMSENECFAVYTVKDLVSVPANSSAMVPLFNEALASATSVLLYQPDAHPGNVYRAVKFTNDTPHNLTKGVCQITLDGEFSGQCLIDTTMRGQETVLPHRLEQGVTTFVKDSQHNQDEVSFSLSGGMLLSTKRDRVLTTYHIESSTDEDLELLIDHMGQLDGDIHCGDKGCDIAETQHGARISVPLKAGESNEIVVVEERNHPTELNIDKHFGNVVQGFRQFVHVHAQQDNPELKACLDILGQIDKTQAALRKEQKQIQVWKASSEELRKNIESLEGHPSLAKMQNKLATLYDNIENAENKTTLGFNNSIESLEEKLKQALKQLSFSWSKQ